MLLNTIRIHVSNEEISASVDHEEDVENEELLHILVRHNRGLHDLHRAYENVDHEDDLGAVVPLHVPIVVRRDYEP